MGRTRNAVCQKWYRRFESSRLRMKIIHERKKCIGCGACAVVCPKYWKIAEDGLSKLKGGKTNAKTGNDELEVKSVDCNKEAAEACPVQIIEIKT